MLGCGGHAPRAMGQRPLPRQREIHNNYSMVAKNGSMNHFDSEREDATTHPEDTHSSPTLKGQQDGSIHRHPEEASMKTLAGSSVRKLTAAQRGRDEARRRMGTDMDDGPVPSMDTPRQDRGKAKRSIFRLRFSML